MIKFSRGELKYIWEKQAKVSIEDMKITINYHKNDNEKVTNLDIYNVYSQLLKKYVEMKRGVKNAIGKGGVTPISFQDEESGGSTWRIRAL